METKPQGGFDAIMFSVPKHLKWVLLHPAPPHHRAFARYSSLIGVILADSQGINLIPQGRHHLRSGNALHARWSDLAVT